MDSEGELEPATAVADRGALEQLFLSQYATVYGVCLNMAQNAHDAEDLAQQTFLQALRHLPQNRADVPLRPWLLRIAHNLCVSHLRRGRFHLPLSDARAVPSRVALPEEELLASETHKQLRAEVARLVPQLRTVIVLRYQAELSYKEIATVIGKPLSIVKNRLFKAHQQLAKAVRAPSNERQGGSDAVQMVGR